MRQRGCPDRAGPRAPACRGHPVLGTRGRLQLVRLHRHLPLLPARRGGSGAGYGSAPRFRVPRCSVRDRLVEQDRDPGVDPGDATGHRGPECRREPFRLGSTGRGDAVARRTVGPGLAPAPHPPARAAVGAWGRAAARRPAASSAPVRPPLPGPSTARGGRGVAASRTSSSPGGADLRDASGPRARAEPALERGLPSFRSPSRSRVVRWPPRCDARLRIG